MKMNCNIADDLLPLYLDNSCSSDSRIAIEEHLKKCPACREKLKRMQSAEYTPNVPDADTLKFADCAKKIRRHRIRVGIFAVLISIAAAITLALGWLTVADMKRQSSPTVYEVGEGVYSLTAGELETTAENVENYVFNTNYRQIAVSVESEGDFSGSIMLWDASDDRTFIMIAKVDSAKSTCTFHNLTSANNYRITCDGLGDAAITVGEGRKVGFFYSLKNVLEEIAEIIIGM